jgi:hypothetical protein
MNLLNLLPLLSAKPLMERFIGGIICEGLDYFDCMLNVLNLNYFNDFPS